MIKYLHCSMEGSYWIPVKLLTHYKDGSYKIKYTDPIYGNIVKDIVTDLSLLKLPKRKDK